MQKKFEKCKLCMIICAAVLGVTVFISVIVAKEANGRSNCTELIVPTVDEIINYGYPVNNNGETYGPDMKDYEIGPDLILAVGVNSNLGYIRPEETLGAEIHSLEDAIEYNKQNTHKTYIPLYMQDGETIIGEFQLG